MPLCSYCTNTIVLRCFDCEQYFCHSFLGTVSSHIVFHLKKTKHNKVGNIVPFKCCKCSVDDVFLLGMLPPVQKSNYEVKAPESNVTDPQRIFCKTCNSSVIPLIQDRTFCSYFRQSEEEESFSSSEDIIFKNTENVPKISVTDQEENTEKITEKPTEIISNNRTINFETPYDYAQNFLKMLKKEHLVDKLIRKQLSLNNTIIEIRNNKIYFNNKGSVGDEIRVEIIDSCNDLKTFENEISEGHSNNFIESHSKTSIEGYSNNFIEGHSKTFVEGHSKTFVESHSKTSFEGHSKTSIEGHSKTSIEGHSKTSIEGHSKTFVESHSNNFIERNKNQDENQTRKDENNKFKTIIKAFIVNDTFTHTIAEISSIKKIDQSFDLSSNTFLCNIIFPFRNISYSRIKRAINMFIKKDGPIINDILTNYNNITNFDNIAEKKNSRTQISKYKLKEKPYELPYELVIKDLLKNESLSLEDSLKQAVNITESKTSSFHMNSMKSERTSLYSIKSEKNEITVLDLKQPPSLPQLNNPQLLAIKHSLNNAITLIQGPPGTGKTVTSVAVIFNHYYLMDKPEKYNKEDKKVENKVKDKVKNNEDSGVENNEVYEVKDKEVQELKNNEVYEEGDENTLNVYNINVKKNEKLENITFYIDDSISSFSYNFKLLMKSRNKESKLLVTAPSNIAIDNISSKMAETFLSPRYEIEQYSGTNHNNKEQYSGINQNNKEQYSGINQNNKEQYSGTNHNNKEQYSGINNGNPDIFIPKYFYNKNTPILRIVSRNREGLSTDLDHFTLHCMTNSILNDIINNNPSFIKNHKKKKKSKVSDKIVEWLTLCEIHGQLFQNNLENKLRTHIEERMMHLFKTHVLTHAPFHSESNYDKQERFRDDSESRGNNTRISSRTLSESREHSLKDKSRNESERNESDGNTVLINSIRYYLIHSHSIIICTLVTAGTPLLFKFSFPFVLIDESVQSTEPMSIIPLCYNIKKLILVGDHKQLGPTVVSDSKKYQQCTCCLESLDSLNDDISLCDASLGYHLNDDVSSDYHLRDHNTHHSKDHLKEHITDYSKDHLKEHITDYSKDHLKEHITDYSKDHLRNHNTHYSKDHITHYSKDHNTHSFNTPEEISKRKDSEEKNYLEEKICNTCAVRTTPLRKSLFERLLKKHVPILLTVQYRMDPLLCEFINRMFYNGRLRTSVQNNFTGLLLPKTFFYNSPFLEEQCGVSYVNKKEALVVIKLLNYLKKSGIKNDEIGIITPYEGQRNYINQLLNSQSSKMIDGYKFLHDSRNMDLYPFNKSIEDTTIEIANVDAFQGREKSFIIISLVRSNPECEIGFLRNRRRMNVALSRAKMGCYLVGDVRTYYYGGNKSQKVMSHKNISNPDVEENKTGENQDENKTGENQGENKTGGNKGENKTGGNQGENKTGGNQGENKTGGNQGERHTAWHHLINWYMRKGLLVEGELENLKSINGKEMSFSQKIKLATSKM